MTKNQTQHKEKVTEKEYSSFQYAYDYFNKHLFEGKLPQCLMTLQRQANAKGYFHAENFRARNDGSKVDEIALNPDTFVGRNDEDILSTLVHEMCHLWNHHFGKPSKPSYHNKRWVKKMLEIGLKPVSLDYPDSMVGQRVTHEIVPNGLFQKVTQQLLKTSFKLNWQSGYLFEFPFPIDFPIDLSSLKLTHKSLFTSIKKKDPSKVKFSCSGCGQNAWAKFSACLFCGYCQKEMLAQD